MEGKSLMINATKVSRNVLTVHLDVQGEKWEKWFMLRSDTHHDSSSNNRKLQKKHLDRARELNAEILDFGDLFDAMQGRYDKRKSYPDMRKEYLDKLVEGKDYLNIIVDDAVDFYSKYADLYLLQGFGNHEESVSKNSDTNLIDLFVKGMQDRGGIIQKGGYSGWVQFFFTMNKTQRQSINLHYTHGYGGGGPVTRDVIQSNRQAVYLPDAHIAVAGHTHDNWVLPISRHRINLRGVLYQDLQYHVRLPGYKMDYGDGYGGWHIERGGPPKPNGCVFLRFYRENNIIKIHLTPEVE